MEKAFELAGFFAAHGIWCVADGEALIPFVGSLNSNGERNLVRFAGDELSACAQKAKAAFDASLDPIAVLVIDALITLPDGKTDALILEIRAQEPTPQPARLAIPYRNASNPQGFAVFRPKFLTPLQTPLAPLADALFRGVDRHEKGAAIWNAKFDQSR